jgi:hypothetical protein
MVRPATSAAAVEVILEQPLEHGHAIPTGPDLAE